MAQTLRALTMLSSFGNPAHGAESSAGSEWPISIKAPNFANASRAQLLSAAMGND